MTMMALRPTLRLHPMSASMLLVVARGLESCASRTFYHAPGAGTTGASYAQASWAPEGFQNYSLVAKRSAGRNSSLLTFALPAGMPTLGAQVISGVKVRRTLAGEALDKSYSPSSHAEAEGTFDLLVKSYEPVKGGGLGHFLCAMEPGDEVEMKVKGAKKINGAPLGRRQYARIGMLAGGTGVAPFMNLVATLLADAEDETLLDLVVSHSEAEDAMLRGELEDLAATLLADPEDATLLDLVVSHSFPEDAMLRDELEALATSSGGRLRVHLNAQLQDLQNAQDKLNANIQDLQMETNRLEEELATKLQNPDSSGALYVLGLLDKLDEAARGDGEAAALDHPGASGSSPSVWRRASVEDYGRSMRLALEDLAESDRREIERIRQDLAKYKALVVRVREGRDGLVAQNQETNAGIQKMRLAEIKAHFKRPS